MHGKPHLDLSLPATQQTGSDETDVATPPSLLDSVLDFSGGRLGLLGKMAHARDEAELESIMEKLLRAEKAWLLSRIGLIPDLDDDVMDEVCIWQMLTVVLHLHCLVDVAKMGHHELVAPARVCEAPQRGRGVSIQASG